jgi:hypothetical protein
MHSGVTSPCAKAPSRSSAYFTIGNRWPSGSVMAYRGDDQQCNAIVSIR